MGRHSSPERVHFLRSLGAWALPWLLILAVVAVALIVAFDMVRNDPLRSTGDDAPQVASTSEEEADEPTPKVSSESEGAEEQEPEDDDAGTDKDASEAKDEPQAPKLVTKGINVQVLNGTNESGVDDVMADKLARLGYTVVAVSPSGRAYEKTVVFWTEGSQEIAAPLAERFDWELEAAPSNLSQEVHLHIMVGSDAT